MRRAEAGVTLIELLVATMLVSIAVIPLLQLVPGTLAPIQVSDSELRLAAVSTRKSEELINRLRFNINSVSTGAEVCTDVANCRVEWTIATELSSGTQNVGLLRTIAIVACRDTNANSVCDSTEDQVRYDTKVTSRP